MAAAKSKSAYSAPHISEFPWTTPQSQGVLDIESRVGDAVVIPSQFAHADCNWIFTMAPPASSHSGAHVVSAVASDVPCEESLPLQVSSRFCVVDDITASEIDTIGGGGVAAAPDDTPQDVFVASVLLFSGSPMYGTKDEYCSYMPHRPGLRDRMSLLVSQTGAGKRLYLPGGPWSADLDGGHPATDDRDLIETAIRWTRTLCGIDLSTCKRWIKFAQFCYDDNVEQGTRTTSVVFLPDIWNTVPSQAEYDTLRRTYLQQWASSQKSGGTGAARKGKKGKKAKPDAKSKNTSKTKMTKKQQKKPQPQSQVKAGQHAATPALDMSKLKIAELRQELVKLQVVPKGRKKADLQAQLRAALSQKTATQSKKQDQEEEEEEGEEEEEEDDDDKGGASDGSAGGGVPTGAPDLPEERCLLVLQPTAAAKTMYGQDLSHKPVKLSRILSRTQRVNGSTAPAASAVPASMPPVRREESAEFELCVAARMFDAMLQRRFAATIFRKLVALVDDSRKDEGVDDANGGEGSEDMYRTLAAFRYFDSASDKTIRLDALTKMVHYLGYGVSRVYFNNLLEEAGHDTDLAQGSTSSQRFDYSGLLLNF